MRIKGLVDEDFVNYNQISMFIGTATCNWKCCEECGEAVCQNLPLAHAKILDIPDKQIVERYMSNPLSAAIVIGGLEPFDQPDELVELVKCFRTKTNDPVVIYTGYTEDERKELVDVLSQFTNIIIKFGRFVPHQEPHYDDILGVKLASPNQYAKKYNWR